MKRWLFLIPLLAGVIAYAPAPWGGLVWDDLTVVEFQLEPFHTLHDVLRPPDGIPSWSYGYNRPIVILSYLLDQRLAGAVDAPMVSHLFNLACHLLTTFFVWLLARRLLRGTAARDAAAVAAATMFAVHPVHTESVSWIAGRSDVLATLFVVPSVLLALRWRDRRSIAALILAPLLFLLAMLSKEIAIAGLPLVALALLLAPQEPPTAGARAPSRAPSRAITFAAAGALFAAATAANWWLRSLGDVVPVEIPALAWPARLGRMTHAAAYYIVKIIMPWPQSAFVSWRDLPDIAISAGVVVLALGLSAWAAWRWWRGGGSAPLLAAGWWWIATAPLLWIAAFAANNTPLAERYLYLPSVAIVPAAGAAFAWACDRGRVRAAIGVTAGLAAIAIAATVSRGFVWRTDFALWSDTARRTDAGLPWVNLGTLQTARGDDGAALASLNKALADPDLPRKNQGRAHLGLGVVLARKGDREHAATELLAAMGDDPDLPEAYYRMGVLYRDTAESMQAAGNTAGRDRAAASALSYLATATRRFPAFHLARLVLAGFLADYAAMLEAQGDADQALRRYQAARDALAAMRAQGAGRPGDAGRVRRAVADSGVDPLALGSDLDAAIARLQASRQPGTG